MLIFLLLGVTLRLTETFQIEDIPIENFSFEKEDVENGAVDVELMPRQQRSPSEDPKDYFFNRNLYEQSRFDSVEDIPRPGGLGSFNEEPTKPRHKRDVTEISPGERDDREVKSLVRKLGKPLELVVMDAENMTSGIESSNTNLPIVDDVGETDNFLINDFIRFRRDVDSNNKAGEDITKVKDLMKQIENDVKRNERYLNYEPRDDYRSRSRYYDPPDRSYDNYNNYSGSKGRQRRIIYYATLPDVTRSPPLADLRDRYDYYRDGRYDDRQFYPDPNYQLRRPYQRARYEEDNDRKAQSPPEGCY
ncbi:hypothetical protein NQ317_007721 [Molorchus minor]|uniref:Uncharacterized protein n=1 Tax=Molorchus minor TaxID=1323400 RepID=A0ABQ9IT56_9CUCU|nr:hypothetical protein NQ317_007721 [Molorchus minor]